MIPELLLESAIRASVFGAGVWLLLRVVRIRSSAHEWLVWLAVLLAALVMPFVVPLATRILSHTLGGVTPLFAVGGLITAAGSLDSAVGDVGDTLRRVGAVIWPGYLIVAAALLTRLGVGLFLLKRIWRNAMPEAALAGADIEVRSTSEIDAPAVTGAGILLPSNWREWSPGTLQCVVAHERSHVARNDFLWQLLTQVHAAIFWASPFAWWLLRRITLLAEYLSDEAALATQQSPAEYAAMLLEFSGGRQGRRPSVGMARRAALSQRIERLLSSSAPPIVRRRSSARLALGVAAIGAASALSPWLRVATTQLAESPIASLGSITRLPNGVDPEGTVGAQTSAPVRAPRSRKAATRTSRATAHLGRLQPLGGASLGPLTGRLSPLSSAPLGRGMTLTGTLTELGALRAHGDGPPTTQP
jgi:beta-lactamase regulating signal transducer with metallopeptidase domain